jgi:hypothetical protein
MKKRTGDGRGAKASRRGNANGMDFPALPDDDHNNLLGLRTKVILTI